MKEELKTEDIIGYLPYGLEIETSDYKIDYVGLRYDILAGINQWSACGQLWSVNTNGGSKPSVDRIKPKLIPLQSLTKDQLVHFSICFRLWYDKPNFDYKLMIYQDIETCHKLHVDYRGLIEKGLAIKK